MCSKMRGIYEGRAAELRINYKEKFRLFHQIRTFTVSSSSSIAGYVEALSFVNEQSWKL